MYTNSCHGDVQPSAEYSIGGNSKRRKLSDSASLTCFSDLPSGILEHAASFLAAPSRVLFLQALHEGDGVSISSSAIVGSHDVLDFGQIETDLAEKLSDDDIHKILQHTDAVNKVKKLLLTNCMNITGAGLEPLRGSAVIEQIDLGILEFPGKRDPSISCDHVLPILDSIIEREGTAVQYLQFPAKWRREIITESDFHAFLERYNEMWERRGDIHCSKCVKLARDPDDSRLEGPWIETRTSMGQSLYGRHYSVCYGCLKYFWYECDNFNSCSKCKKSYCTECADVQYCGACGENYCRNYCNTFYRCEGTAFYNMRCLISICDDCAYSKKRECRGCKKCYCSSRCSNRKCEQEINRCDHCHSVLCYECENPLNSSNSSIVAEYINQVLPGRHDIDRLRKCDQCNKAACPACQLELGNSDCKGCIKMIVTALLEEKAMNKKLEEENKELKIQNRQLKWHQRYAR